MLEKNFKESLTFKFFNESLNLEFLKNKFDLVINSVDSSNELLYVLKYKRIFYNVRGVLNYANIIIQG